MRFLIHSNGPTIATGYGVQTRHLADRLAAEGHEVAVSCTYGHQGQLGTWRSPSGHDVRLYPSGYEINSPDMLIGHAEHFFEGDPSSGWIILLVDVWAFQRPLLMKTLRESFQVISWCPVDHFPAPKGVIGFLQGAAAVPVAMSQYGRDQLARAGLTPGYVPLAVDTKAYRPTFALEANGETYTSRDYFDLHPNAFVVGMVAMNKGWSKDRKGFAEAFQAFGRFWRDHRHAVLFVHTERTGAAEGIDLDELAAFCGIPPHAIKFSDQYAYRFGFPPNMMAGLYTSFDVLLAPSRGEGFCVPIIEAQACGVPVIASDFTAQSELVGAGWKVGGQLDWDPAQHAWFKAASVDEIVAALEDAHDSDLGAMQTQAVEFAAQYDVDTVFDRYWRPFLSTLEPPPPVERPPFQRVDVIVPLMRPENLDRLMTSIGRDKDAHVIIVHDNLDDAVAGYPVTSVSTRQELTSYAEKVNQGYQHSTADAILVVGDDVEFTEGWLTALIEASTRGDVVGTNDSEPGRVRNPDVAAGRHADHFAIRRAYIEDEGSSLDGPGIVMPDAYRHWFVDREVIELAKARGVYTHAHDCRIIHHHPGYDGDEAARYADPSYALAVEHGDEDRRTWLSRAPLIEGHRVGVTVHPSYVVNAA